MSTGPPPADDTHGIHALGHQRAPIDDLDSVRAVTSQSDRATLGDGVPDAAAPAQPLEVARNRLDRHRLVYLYAVDVGEAPEPAQLLAHHLGLESALRVEGRVLPVAPSAGACVGARRLHAVGRGLEHRDHVRSKETSLRPGARDDHLEPFPRKPVADEHHLALVPCDHVTAMGDPLGRHHAPVARRCGTARCLGRHVRHSTGVTHTCPHHCV